MNSIYRLRESLYRALSSPETHNDESELFDELMVQKPRLLKLLDVGPRNVQEQRELESGELLFLLIGFGFHRLLRQDCGKWRISRREHGLCETSHFPLSTT
jgi:hypothetical protein